MGKKEEKLGHTRAVQNGEKGWQKIEKTGQRRKTRRKYTQQCGSRPNPT